MILELAALRRFELPCSQGQFAAVWSEEDCLEFVELLGHFP